jgi:hypothetical protein
MKIKIFEQIDKNNDKKISKEEFKELIKQIFSYKYMKNKKK